jgi:hypothetical protein
MRCLVCAAEMYVAQVVEDGTMPVPGFEHPTLKCLECGDIERRLAFTREKTQPVSPNPRRVAKPRTLVEARKSAGEMRPLQPREQRQQQSEISKK